MLTNNVSVGLAQESGKLIVLVLRVLDISFWQWDLIISVKTFELLLDCKFWIKIGCIIW